MAVLPAMRCDSCETVWYSRVAALIVRNDDLARCVKCGGRLSLDQQEADQAFGTAQRREASRMSHASRTS